MTLEAYADLDTFRLFIRATPVVAESEDADSVLEALALESASRAIERACGRTFKVAGDTATARVFTPNPMGRDLVNYVWVQHFLMPIDDVSDSTGFSVAFDATGNGDYTNTLTSGYRLGPRNSHDNGFPYTHILFDTGVHPPTFAESVEITALWGWTEVPSTIVNATLLQAARFLKRRDAVFGVAGSPEMGNELRLLAKIDPDVAVMVGAFKRNWGAV